MSNSRFRRLFGAHAPHLAARLLRSSVTHRRMRFLRSSAPDHQLRHLATEYLVVIRSHSSQCALSS